MMVLQMSLVSPQATYQQIMEGVRKTDAGGGCYSVAEGRDQVVTWWSVSQ